MLTSSRPRITWEKKILNNNNHILLVCIVWYISLVIPIHKDKFLVWTSLGVAGGRCWQRPWDKVHSRISCPTHHFGKCQPRQIHLCLLRMLQKGNKFLGCCNYCIIYEWNRCHLCSKPLLDNIPIQTELTEYSRVNVVPPLSHKLECEFCNNDHPINALYTERYQGFLGSPKTFYTIPWFYQTLIQQ